MEGKRLDECKVKEMMLLKGISRLLSVTLAGSMQVLFNAPSAFVLRRLRLVLHPSQIHQPRYSHCISTSQVMLAKSVADPNIQLRFHA